MTYIETRRLQKLGKLAPVKKSKKPIPKKSKKRIKQDRQYKKLVVIKMAEDVTCELKTPVCTYYAEGLDHTQKRSPANVLKKVNTKRSCNACNLWKELNPKQAEEMGISVSKFVSIEENS